MNDEQAAQEYFSSIQLEPGYDLNRAFLAGIEYARTPIKIDLNDSKTWPPERKGFLGFDGLVWWQGYFENIKKSMITHWLPLPILEEDK